MPSRDLCFGNRGSSGLGVGKDEGGGGGGRIKPTYRVKGVRDRCIFRH